MNIISLKLMCEIVLIIISIISEWGITLLKEITVALLKEKIYKKFIQQNLNRHRNETDVEILIRVLQFVISISIGRFQ